MYAATVYLVPAVTGIGFDWMYGVFSPAERREPEPGVRETDPS